tara:strand:+ start:249 stop:584 length:336 start_codon:yes stop_codon:yes gene_type:complete
MNNIHLDNLTVLISFLVLVYISITKNQEVRRVSNKLTTGWINTLLIMLILLLTMTENLRLGLLISLLYLIVVVRFNNGLTENFSQYGPSPLKCSTYGDSKEKTGTSFYPIN